jgi:hypothetical protein
LGFFVNKKLAELKRDLDLTARKHALTLRSQIDFKERQLSEFVHNVRRRGKALLHARPAALVAP